MSINSRFSLCALAVAVSLQPARAAVLFSDSFLVNPPGDGTQNTCDLNQNLPGREGGTLGAGGLISYGSNLGANAQVGNPTGGIDGGNYLLNAFGAVSGPNANFNQGPGPLTISFDFVPNLGPSPGAGSYISGNGSSWTSLVLSNSATPVYPFVVNADFGILWRGNGNIQVFSGGNLLTNDTPVFAEDWQFHHIDAVISDLAGTGSGFTGGGTRISLFADNGALPFATYSSADAIPIPAFTNNQIAFGTNGDTISAVDNLSISVVPEPGTFALLAPVGLGFLIRRRR